MRFMRLMNLRILLNLMELPDLDLNRFLILKIN